VTGGIRFVIAQPDARDVSRLDGDASGHIMFGAGTGFRVVSITTGPDGRIVIHLAHS